MARPYAFNFPRSRFVPFEDGEHTRRGQAEQIAQEAAEAFSAAERGDERAYLVELLDCIHACETALAEFGPAEIERARDEVVEKNAERGYYEKPAMAEYMLPMDYDPVDHPGHYESGSVQAVEVIERVVDGLDARQAYSLGNVLKYAIRAGKKGTADVDMENANNYAHRLCTGRWRWER